jgi:hypothetical protein
MGSRAESAAEALVTGVVAGVAGTAMMTAYQSLVSRVRSGASGNGSNGQPRRWKDAPALAQVGRRVVKQTLGAKVPLDRAAVLGNAVPWAYGVAQGLGYGAVRSLAPGLPRFPLGIAFGTAIWGASYLVLPRMGIYKPVTKYPPRTLALDLSYHLVYGLSVASAFAVVGRVLGPGSERER